MSNPEIPLFATPYILESGLPSPTGLSSPIDGQPPAPAAEPIIPEVPGTYRVVVGPGRRLVRVLEPTKVTQH